MFRILSNLLMEPKDFKISEKKVWTGWIKFSIHDYKKTKQLTKKIPADMSDHELLDSEQFYHTPCNKLREVLYNVFDLSVSQSVHSSLDLGFFCINTTRLKLRHRISWNVLGQNVKMCSLQSWNHGQYVWSSFIPPPIPHLTVVVWDKNKILIPILYLFKFGHFIF